MTQTRAKTKSPAFIHLRVHTAYSLLEGALQIKDLPQTCRKMAMPALAITDTNNMFGALEFAEALGNSGIQPIIGCQMDLRVDTTQSSAQTVGDNPPAGRPIVLLAQNKTGYDNLLRLNSRLYLHEDVSKGAISIADLSAHNDGLICLSGGALGPIGKILCDGQKAKAKALMQELATIFPTRFYIELHRHGTDNTLTPEQSASEADFIDLAYTLDLPLVATNDAYFANKDMFAAHDALICIANNARVDQQSGRRRLTPEYYLKTPDEMIRRFADLPEAIENTIEIAKRCAFKPSTQAPILPKFADDEVSELRRQAVEGLTARLKTIEPSATVDVYEKRLEFELDIIINRGFPGYFLIVADFIRWAKDNNIPVGPGRGSGAGSLVAYVLQITDLDPLRYSLLFERFLNPERASMPDFDIDFCMERREEVIQYVQQKYGRDRVAQIITFGALLSKAALRDVGRVLNMPYPQVDRLAKLIPEEGVKPVSIKKALKDEPRLRDAVQAEEIVKRLMDYAGQLEGLLRNASTHAAGVVIGDRPLDELVPLYQDPRSSMPATQFNMKWAEKAGLVKFDFLGLRTLTVIQYTLDFLRIRGIDIDISAIDLTDKKTFDLYSAAKTIAVFQVESSGMMDALRRMRPTCIEDIVALVALYRPGPIENIPLFCDIKNNRAKRQKMHDSIDHLLDETQGIIVYQEQVMEIAQVMAGYTLGGADSLRRAMGKKIQAEMDKEKPKFIAGALANGVPKGKADEVWNLLDKFANYGFNKSHAAAYALVSYQTAWLKANYPLEFMAAVMTCDIHNTDKMAVYYREVEALGLVAMPPCVNKSEATFSVKDGKIFYALGALKNVGVEVMRLISDARKDGEFTDLFDFARRVDLRRVGKRALERLAAAGAFDCLDGNRRRVHDGIESLVGYSNTVISEKNSQQNALFGGGDELPPPPLPDVKDFLPNERLIEEHLAIGFYLSGHPLDDYQSVLARKSVLTFAQMNAKVEKEKDTLHCKLAGAVASKKERVSAKGNKFAFVQLSDPTGLYEVSLFSEALAEYRGLLESGQNVVLNVEAGYNDGQLRLNARKVQTVEGFMGDVSIKGLRIFVDEAAALESVAARLGDLSGAGARGSQGAVHLVLRAPDLDGDVELALKDSYPLNLQMKSAFKGIAGVLGIEEF